jgi:hypothetical protein
LVLGVLLYQLPSSRARVETPPAVSDAQLPIVAPASDDTTGPVEDPTRAIQFLQDEPAERGTLDQVGLETLLLVPSPEQSVAPPEGEILVRTEPEGARVTVNGIGWGTTPLTIRHLPVGDKRIRVSKEGYASQERSVRLGEGQPSVTVTIRLNTAP